MKHLPFAILGLTLIPALVVLGLGVRFSREERVEVVGDSRTPAAAFAAKFLSEIEDLEELYVGHLLDLRESVGWTTSFELASRSRNIEGVEQITIFDASGRARETDLRRVGQSEKALPIPRVRGTGGVERTVVVDLEALSGEDFGPGYEWIDQPGYELHFAARLDKGGGIVFRINREIVRESIENWLGEHWMPDALEPVRTENVALVVRGPDERSVGGVGAPPVEESPSILVPVSSVFGDWTIAAWDRTETAVSYHQPILLGTSAVGLLIALGGILGFFQQQQAIRLAEQRVSFVNRVSHELRTPLTNILLNIDLASESVSGDGSDAKRRLDLIREETGRLSRLLENVLTFSRRERARFDREGETRQSFTIIPCDPWAIVDDVLSQFRASLDRKGIAVHKGGIPDGVRVSADPDALSQVISNLVSNVEKYASAGGGFEIDVEVDPADSSRALIRVADHGPGIRRPDREKVFLPFLRLNESTTEGVSGTGLGLSISRDLVESMGGRLELTSREDSGEGACFELSLPRVEGNIISMAS